MARTKYSNLSNDELLRQVADLRRKSPIIDELANRLDAISNDGGSYSKSCPICEAELTVTVSRELGNPMNESVTLEAA